MGKRRLLLGTWGLVVAAALLAPAAAQAQVFLGLPTFGRPPVMLPGYYSPYGMGSGYPYGYGGLPYGGYGSAYGGYPYGGMPYTTFQTYQPLYSQAYSQSYTLGTGLPLLGLPPAGQYASTYPRMRSAYYPPGTAYTGTGLSAVTGASLGGLPGLPPTTYAGLQSGTPASAVSYGPVACASFVCGSLNYAPVAYGPAGYAATAVAMLGPPPRARQANYPADPGIRAAALSSYGNGPRRAEVELHVPTPNTQVWFDGVKMTLSGKRRHFFTPRLEPGARYTYEVRARWEENGQTRERTRSIFLRPGDVLDVDFSHRGKTP